MLPAASSPPIPTKQTGSLCPDLTGRHSPPPSALPCKPHYPSKSGPIITATGQPWARESGHPGEQRKGPENSSRTKPNFYVSPGKTSPFLLTPELTDPCSSFQGLPLRSSTPEGFYIQRGLYTQGYKIGHPHCPKEIAALVHALQQEKS